MGIFNYKKDTASDEITKRFLAFQDATFRVLSGIDTQLSVLRKFLELERTAHANEHSDLITETTAKQFVDTAIADIQSILDSALNKNSQGPQ